MEGLNIKYGARSKEIQRGWRYWQILCTESAEAGAFIRHAEVVYVYHSGLYGSLGKQCTQPSDHYP